LIPRSLILRHSEAHRLGATMQIILAWIAEALISAAAELLALGIGYGVARVGLPLVSFGRIRLEPLRSPSTGFNLLGYRYVDGVVEIAATTAGLLGWSSACSPASHSLS
jgi:hypothetical protein